VTTKLTATPQTSTTGPGWSRPSSASPSIVPSPSSTPNANSSSQGPPPAAPQLPHAGKVIQPQPRAIASGSQSGSSRVDSSGSNKPVWGNVKAAASKWNSRVQNDFPTAAEVAQGMYHNYCDIHIYTFSLFSPQSAHQSVNRKIMTRRKQLKQLLHISKLEWRRRIHSEGFTWIQMLITGTRSVGLG
jgi:hypothetical protein